MPKPDIGRKWRFLPQLGVPSEYYHSIRCGKTRKLCLSGGETILKIRLFVSTEYTKMTDRQTDGRTSHDRI